MVKFTGGREELSQAVSLRKGLKLVLEHALG